MLVVDGRPRRLRLIQLGRLLTDGTFLVPYTVQLLSKRAKLVQKATKPNSQVLLEGLEAVGREIGVSVRGSASNATATAPDEKGKRRASLDIKGKGKEKDQWNKLEGTEAEEDERVWLQCSVGEPMEEEELTGEQDKDQVSSRRPR